MREYIDNGVRLGWLIDPIEKRVYIYRPGQSVAVLDNPVTLSGDPVLPGFTLHVGELWEKGCYVYARTVLSCKRELQFAHE